MDLNEARDFREFALPLGLWIEWKLDLRRKNGEPAERPDIGYFRGSEGTIFVDKRAEIGDGTFLFPNAMILGQSSIANHVLIGSDTQIISSVIKTRARLESCTIEESEVKDEARIGPGAQLKRTRFGVLSTMNHYGYLGDCEVGYQTNIGAGVVTANFDGETKSKTKIGDGCFIGCGVILLAPTTLPPRTYVAAGTIIGPGEFKDPGKLYIGRTKAHRSSSIKVAFDQRGWHRIKEK